MKQVPSSDVNAETGFSVFETSMRTLGYEPSHFSIGNPLFLAVSGGADSLFLAICTKRWLDRVGNANACLALVVDHGLRASSTEEADHTVAQLASWGVKAHKLTWEQAVAFSVTGKGHDKRVSEAASRAARYALINAFIASYDTYDKDQEPVLLTGHHSDDQFETFLLRLERKSGVFGLACMSASVRQEGHEFRILRPLLPLRRSDIEEALKSWAPNVKVVSDPSNQDLGFRRNWFRHNRQTLEQTGLGHKNVAALIRCFGKLRSFVDEMAIGFIDQACKCSDLGFACIDRTSFEELTEETKAAVLRRLIAWLSPRGHELVRLRDKARLFGTGGTTSHVVVKPSGKKLYLFACQKRHRQSIRAGRLAQKGHIFDGRFQVGSFDAEFPDFYAAYVGRSYADQNLKSIRACLRVSMGMDKDLPSYLIAALVCLRSKQNPAEFHMPAIKFSSVEKPRFSGSLDYPNIESLSGFGKLVKQGPSSDRFVVV